MMRSYVFLPAASSQIPRQKAAAALVGPVYFAGWIDAWHLGERLFLKRLLPAGKGAFLKNVCLKFNSFLDRSPSTRYNSM